MKRITALILGVTLLGVGFACAQDSSQLEQSSVQPITVGNKHCPVTGEEVGKMGPPITFTYNGKVYNLCCPGCKNAFGNNPEKFSKIADDDVKITK